MRNNVKTTVIPAKAGTQLNNFIPRCSGPRVVARGDVLATIIQTAILTIILAFSSNAFAANILISKTVDHPALDATTRGIIAGLASAGYENGRGSEIRVESAQGNASLASQISSKFVSQNPDIVIGVGTVSAQSFIKYATSGRVKMIFSTVTDPLGAGLVKSLDKPGNNISGVSNFVPLEPQLALFKEMQPGLKKLGILYNPSELNSVSIVKRLEILCPKLDLTLVKQTIAKTSDAAQNTAKLASDVDAIFISNDNTALAALQSIIAVSNKSGIPVYVSDTDAVKLGAKAALGPDQYEVGLQTARMIARVLKGGDINAMKVEFPDKTDLVVGTKK